MDTSTPSPHLDTRASLLDAALRCFAQYGYDATSIRLVASKAGKNSSLISYYFKGKEGLYRAVFEQLLTRFDSRPPEIWSVSAEAGPVDPETARMNLRALIGWLLTEIDSHLHSDDPWRDAAMRLFLSELQSPKEEVRDLLRERMLLPVNAMRECVKALRPDLSGADVDFWGNTIHGCCVSQGLMAEMNALVWTETDPALSIDEMADRLTGFACRGLART